MEQLISLWKNLKNWQKWAAVLGILIIVAAVFTMNLKPNNSGEVLYSNLSTSDSRAIEKQLTQMGVNFSLTNSGSEIDVKGMNTKQVIQLRLKLGALGLPSFGNPGLSNFTTSVGSSTFDQNVKYTEELKSELDADLAQINGVQSASVTFPLTGQSDSIFASSNSPTSATVILNLAAGTSLTSSQVTGVQNYVASNFHGMKAKNVTVLDQNSNILSNGDALSSSMSSVSDTANKELQITAETENQIKNKILDTLSAAYGYNDVRVVVNASINFDQVKQQIETYAPKGTLVSSENTTNATNNNNITVNGVAGTASNTNTPGYNATTNTGNGTASNSKSQDLIQNWDVGKTVQTIIQSPKLLNLNVAVWVNKPLTTAQKNQLTTWTEVAAGITKNNGVVDITDQPFANNTSTIGGGSIKNTSAPTQDPQLKEVIYLLIGMIGVLVIIGFILILVRRRKKETMIPMYNENQVVNPQQKESELEEVTKKQEDLTKMASKIATENKEKAIEYISSKLREE